MNTLTLIKSDFYRVYGKTNVLTLIKGFILQDTLRFLCFFRLRASDSKLISFLGRALIRLDSTRDRLQLPHGLKVGYGLYIGHGGPVICNPTAVIGNNVNLS